MSLVLLLLTACDKRLPHGGEDPVYPLRGLHAAVPCEGCHGPGTPESLPTACIDCHDADRPTPDHNAGQDCATCHVEDGWDVGHTVTDTDTDPPTPPTGFDHAALPAEQLCWDCHEAERSEPTHYADPVTPTKSWDCGPCHTVNAWDEAPYVHPARTPHGTHVGRAEVEQPPEEWVVACTSCHPVALTAFDCSTCHLAIFPHPYSEDTVAPGPTADATCMNAGCHESADL
jgi:hypothetical protein